MSFFDTITKNVDQLGQLAVEGVEAYNAVNNVLEDEKPKPAVGMKPTTAPTEKPVQVRISTGKLVGYSVGGIAGLITLVYVLKKL